MAASAERYSSALYLRRTVANNAPLVHKWKKTSLTLIGPRWGMLRCGAKSRWLIWKSIRCEQEAGNGQKEKQSHSNNLYPTLIRRQQQSIIGDVVVISVCSFKLRHAMMVLTVASVRGWRIFKPGSAILAHIHHRTSVNGQQSDQSMWSAVVQHYECVNHQQPQQSMSS